LVYAPDTPFILDTLAARYPVIYAAGVSLGGNALAKYLGEQGSNALPRAAAAISAPVDATLAGISGFGRLRNSPYGNMSVHC